jgi:hypothetical protein
MNDWVGNGFSLTLESSVDKNLPASKLRDHWEWCREALFMSMEILYKYGLHGIVTDEMTGQPINKVKIIREGDLPNRNQLTDSCGRYVTYMNTGIYDLTFEHPDYEPYVESNFDFDSYEKKYYLHVQLSNLNTKNNKAFINENIAIIPLTNGIKIGGKLVGKKASIGIYNVTGKLVKVLAVNGKEVVWDGRDSMGRNLSSGCYLLRLSVNNKAYTKNFILNR